MVSLCRHFLQRYFKFSWRPGRISFLFISFVFCVLLFRSVFYEPFKIPSGSMYPTLYIGDFIFVNKFSYGLKIPFADFVGKNHYVLKFKKPQRGDIIVFQYPKDLKLNYIKRVVGLPGEKILIKEKDIFINGKKVNLRDNKNKYVDHDINEELIERLIVDINDLTPKNILREHLVQFRKGRVDRGEIGPIIIPQDSYFVMGDNRDYSNDSRYWGFVSFDTIVGRAEYLWLSIDMEDMDNLVLRDNRSWQKLK